MTDQRPPRRKRVSALVPLSQFKQLEEMAEVSREPVSGVVARIIRTFLARRLTLESELDEDEACHQEDSGDSRR